VQSRPLALTHDEESAIMDTLSTRGWSVDANWHATRGVGADVVGPCPCGVEESDAMWTVQMGEDRRGRCGGGAKSQGQEIGVRA
jgi:hypothetical protein